MTRFFGSAFWVVRVGFWWAVFLSRLGRVFPRVSSWETREALRIDFSDFRVW